MKQFFFAWLGAIAIAVSTTANANQKQQIYYRIAEPPKTSDFSLLDPAEDLLNSVRTTFYYLLNFKPTETGPETPAENYKRTDHFGRWVNDPTDDTCWNTRAKVLIRNSLRPVEFRNEKNCVVDTGEWHDPFTGLKFREARVMQVDHTVPLKHAYEVGAHKWDKRARCLFANFLNTDYHLIPVYGRENSSKGDRGPDQYLPPNEQFTCEYVKNWLKIKMAWKLPLPEEEVDAIRETAQHYQCSLTSFRFSLAELKKTREEINNNLDYCYLNKRL